MSQSTKRRRRKVKFDPKKPRAVNMKVRCAAPKSNRYGYDLGNDEKCETVYLRIVENENNPTELDLKTTHKKCPICGSDEWENLTDWELRKDKTTVVIKSKDPI